MSKSYPSGHPNAQCAAQAIIAVHHSTETMKIQHILSIIFILSKCVLNIRYSKTIPEFECSQYKILQGLVEHQSLYHKPWNDQPKFVTSTLEHMGTNHTKYLYGTKKNLRKLFKVMTNNSIL